MALPELVRHKVEKELTEYCEKRVPLRVRDQVRMSFGIRGNSATIYEERPLFWNPSEWSKMPIAQFRYGDDGEWTLYCADRNSRWHESWDSDPSADLRDLLKEVEKDPTGIFWG